MATRAWNNSYKRSDFVGDCQGAITKALRKGSKLTQAGYIAAIRADAVEAEKIAQKMDRLTQHVNRIALLCELYFYRTYSKVH